MQEKAMERLVQARESASNGDYKQALKHVSVSISFAPSAESYIERAEINLELHDFENALDDIDRVSSMEIATVLQERLQRLRNRADAALDECTPVGGASKEASVRIGVAVPVSCKNFEQAFDRLLKGKVSSDGQTLVRKVAGSAIWDVKFVEHDDELVQIMLSQPVLSKVEQLSVRKHGMALYISGPNEAVLPPDLSQLGAAENLLLTVGDTIDAIGGVGVYLLSSGLVCTADHWKKCATDLNAQDFVDAFVCFVEDEEEGHFYSCGMHALGFPDVQLIGTPCKPLDFMREVVLATLINEQDGLEDEIDFLSVVWQANVTLALAECEHFEPEHPYFNPFGMWTVEC